MSEAVLRSRIAGLAPAAGALAAFGAALRLRRDGTAAPPAVQRHLDEVLAAFGAPPLDSLDAGQTARLCDLATMILRHALELLDNPSRPPVRPRDRQRAPRCYGSREHRQHDQGENAPGGSVGHSERPRSAPMKGSLDQEGPGCLLSGGARRCAGSAIPRRCYTGRFPACEELMVTR
jgi:hypothetical protein